MEIFRPMKVVNSMFFNSNTKIPVTQISWVNAKFLLFLWILFSSSQIILAQGSEAKPNFIVIFVDDLGYGDLGVYGHPTIKTPNIDKMVAEGQKWTNFYAGASVCTPSRAALLTGRLPIRNGLISSKERVFFPNSVNGIPSSEVTLAEQLKKADYATACIGKWHLGHKNEYLPNAHGFDYFFGIPYSNDMNVIGGVEDLKALKEDPQRISPTAYDVPLIKNTEVIEQPVNQTTITKRYTGEALSFIKTHKQQPFFLYLAHTMPHVPLFASQNFQGKSARGTYGDVVEEIDAGVGEILNLLKKEGIANNTIVVFTSDNGPWRSYKTSGGSTGLLSGGKGTTWEGGMRVPCVFWSPSKIKPSVIVSIGATMDLFATFSNIANIPIPEDRIVDGVDLSDALFHDEESPRKDMFFYRGQELYAVRMGNYKAHFITEGAYGMFGEKEVHRIPLLYDLNQDPSENYDIAEKYPDVIEKINVLVSEHNSKLIVGKDLLAERQ